MEHQTVSNFESQSQAFMFYAFKLSQLDRVRSEILNIRANFDLNIYSIYAEIKLRVDDAIRILEVDTVDSLARSQFLSAALALLPSEYQLSDQTAPQITNYGFVAEINEGIEDVGAIPFGISPPYQSNPYNISVEIDIENLKAIVFATIPFLSEQITDSGAILLKPLQYP